MSCQHDTARHHLNRINGAWHWVCSMCGETTPMPKREPLVCADEVAAYSECARAAQIAAARAKRDRWWPLIGIGCTLACLAAFLLVVYVGWHVCCAVWA